MNVEVLMKNYKKHNPEGCFFNQSWLNFFGEDIGTMCVSDKIVEFEGHKCYELTTYQRNSPYADKTAKFYFDCKDYSYITK